MKEKKHLTRMIAVIVAGALVVAVLCVSFLSDLMESRIQLHQKEQETEETEPIVDLEFTYAYQNPQWDAAIEKVVEDFQKEYPEIRVNIETTYESQVYENVLTSKIARNDLGDIVQLKTPDDYAKSGLLGEIPAEVAEQVDSTYQMDGKTYAVGAVATTWGILYNKDYFTQYGLEEPQDYMEFLQVCNRIKGNGITSIGVGGGDLWHLEYWMNHFFRTDVIAQNPDWLKACAEGSVFWTDEAPTQMMNHLVSLFQSGYVNEDWMDVTDNALTYRMSEGDVAMIYTAASTAESVKQLNPEMELGWFYLGNDQGKTYAADNHDTYWAITTSCAEDPVRYEAATAFLNFFYQEENYGVLCERTYSFPEFYMGIQAEADGIHKEVHEARAEADCLISDYIGDGDTPQGFEKSMLMVLKQTLNQEQSVEKSMEILQHMWDYQAELEVAE